jgi:hypothetical protein
MDPETAIEDHIEPKLLEEFGLSRTRVLMTTATLAYVTTVGGKIVRYRAFLDSICSNRDVLRQWGDERSAKQCEEWKDLVPLDPEPVVILTGPPS